LLQCSIGGYICFNAPGISDPAKDGASKEVPMTYEETFGETVFAMPQSSANDWFYTPFCWVGTDCEHYFSDVFVGRFF
jgi:hypothetical protein